MLVCVFLGKTSIQWISQSTQRNISSDISRYVYITLAYDQEKLDAERYQAIFFPMICIRMSCRVPARRGLQQTARAGTRHGARNPLVCPQVDQTYRGASNLDKKSKKRNEPHTWFTVFTKTGWAWHATIYLHISDRDVLMICISTHGYQCIYMYY